jgi:hypothetical protein
MYHAAGWDGAACLRGEVLKGYRHAIISSFDELYGPIEVRCRLNPGHHWTAALMERSSRGYVPVYSAQLPCAIVEVISEDLPVVRAEQEACR